MERAKPQTLWTAISLFVLSVLLLLPFVGNFFVSDDFDLIREVSTGGPFAIWSHAPSLFLRPIVSVSMWINHVLGGWNSPAFNVPNAILHGLNVVLVFFLARAFISLRNGEARDSAMLPAILAALLFMVAPGHAEAVFFISCRTDLLAAFFGLLSATLYLRAVGEQRQTLLIWSALSFALGCLCKESNYGLVLFFVGTAFLVRKTPAAKTAWIGAGSLVFVVLLALVLRSQVVTESLPYSAGGGGVVGLAKDGIRLVVIFVKSVVPIDLGLSTGRGHVSVNVAEIAILVALAIVIAAVSLQLTRRLRNEQKALDLAPVALGFLAAAIPVCFLSVPIFSPENGRFTYLPGAFAAILVACLATRCLKGKTLLWGIVATVTLGSAFTVLNGVGYRHAAGVCDATVAWAKRGSPAAPYTVFMVPDSAGGRYIWRNGLESALQTFAPQWTNRPNAIARYVGGAPPISLSSTEISQVDYFGEHPPSADATVVAVDRDGSIKTSRAEVALPAKAAPR